MPTLILHGDDDQIVPIADSALLAAKIVKGATLKVIKGAPHGMPMTLKNEIQRGASFSSSVSVRGHVGRRHRPGDGGDDVVMPTSRATSLWRGSSDRRGGGRGSASALGEHCRIRIVALRARRAIRPTHVRTDSHTHSVRRGAGGVGSRFMPRTDSLRPKPPLRSSARRPLVHVRYAR